MCDDGMVWQGLSKIMKCGEVDCGQCGNAYGVTVKPVKPVNADIFQRYIETQLVPTLAKGDIVIMDNLSSHKRTAIRAAIRAAAARLLFLPPYSPDLNPIEQVFAKLKHLLRKASKRTVEATWQQITEILDQFTPKECTNYIRNSGYTST